MVTDGSTDLWTDRPTDQLTEIAIYRAAIAARNVIFKIKSWHNSQRQPSYLPIDTGHCGLLNKKVLPWQCKAPGMCDLPLPVVGQLITAFRDLVALFCFVESISRVLDAIIMSWNTIQS